MPHMHLRGKSFQYTAAYPDGKSEVLLSVPAYDFGWQSVYRLAEPKKLAQGDAHRLPGPLRQLDEKPANPDPTKTVRWGEQTFEEMMIGYLVTASPKHPPEKPAGVPRCGACGKPMGTWKLTSGQPATEITITDDGSIDRAPSPATSWRSRPTHDDRMAHSSAASAR